VPTPDGDLPIRRAASARGPARLTHAVRALEPEQRIAALAALALWASMFLPWYGKSVTETVKDSLRAAGYDLTAFGAFSFVEAAVLLVAAAVLLLLFARAERRAFHLPGGDGLVILAGGVWVSLLIFYRMLDKPGTTGNDRLTTTVGLQWGIFVALAAAISLAYAGARVRAAHRPEPALRDDPTVPRDVAAPRPAGRRAPASSRRGAPGRLDASAAREAPTPRGRSPRTPAADEPTRRASQRPLALPPRPGIPAAGPLDPRPYIPAPPFDADADADSFIPLTPPVTPAKPPPFKPATPGFPPATPGARADPGPADDDTVDRRAGPSPSIDDPPTRVNRRVPRFDDLDAEWIPTDRLSLEADPPPPPDDDR
jgi:hypothetical protein